VTPTVLFWSGGKDSLMTLLSLETSADYADYKVTSLLTTLTEDDRVSAHGVRRALARRQAERLGLPVSFVTLPHAASNAAYEREVRGALARFKGEGIGAVAFGDLFLEDLRAYREGLVEPLGIKPLFPLWGRDTGELARAFLEAGYGAVTVCVDADRLTRGHVGRPFDAAFLASLPEGVDVCGERGEFHTFVHRGPRFMQPLSCQVGAVLQRGRFYTCELEAS